MNEPFVLEGKVKHLLIAAVVILAVVFGFLALGYWSGHRDAIAGVKQSICEKEGHTWEYPQCFDPVEVKLP
jgi:hypothetical protein